MINIRDALDILERAKSSAENIERYAYDCDFGEARLVILELIAEIERLQDLIDKPPEDADWVADYHLLQSALDGPIIDAARKWHAAYRKAQNSNLMRAKEVERLRSENKIISDRAAHHDRQDAKEIELLAARIAELEAGKLMAEGKIGGVKTEYGGQHHCGTQIIRNDAGEWHCPKCNPLLTAEQREALEMLLDACFVESLLSIEDFWKCERAVQSLLSGSKPAWEATDERINSLLAIIGMLNTEVYDKSGPLFEERNRLVRMLLAMLEEAEHGTKNRR